MATVDLWMAFALSAAPRQRPRVHSLLAKKTGEGTLTAAAVAAAVAGYGGPLESLFEPLLALAQDMLSSGRLGAVVAHAQVTPLPLNVPLTHLVALVHHRCGEGSDRAVRGSAEKIADDAEVLGEGPGGGP